MFRYFRTVTDEEVCNTILQSSSTTCDLDPIPTPILKKFLDELIPIMTTVFNDSFVTGCFPDKFKHANILPKLKGSSLNTEELKNYRPIANLRFFAKILEKLVASQLQTLSSRKQFVCQISIRLSSVLWCRNSTS